MEAPDLATKFTIVRGSRCLFLFRGEQEMPRNEVEQVSPTALRRQR